MRTVVLDMYYFKIKGYVMELFSFIFKSKGEKEKINKIKRKIADLFPGFYKISLETNNAEDIFFLQKKGINVGGGWFLLLKEDTHEKVVLVDSRAAFKVLVITSTGDVYRGGIMGWNLKDYEDFFSAVTSR